jgi:hypothetical protein
MNNLYSEYKNTDNYKLREFSEDIDEDKLVWHRDLEDRLLKITNNNNSWKIQIDNELPRDIDYVFIPKLTYHRLIKGEGNLTISITF